MAWNGQHQVETSLREEIAHLRDLMVANNVDPNIVSTQFGFLIIKKSQRTYADADVWILRCSLNWIEAVFDFFFFNFYLFRPR
jgi:hypothetical protein